MNERTKEFIFVILAIVFAVGVVAFIAFMASDKDLECVGGWEIIKENNVVNNGVVYGQNYTVRCKETGVIKTYKGF